MKRSSVARKGSPNTKEGPVLLESLRLLASLQLIIIIIKPMKLYSRLPRATFTTVATKPKPHGVP